MEEACERNDTKKLAKLLPGAHAVDPALLPAIAQVGNEPKLLMLEDCPHWMWWDQNKELRGDLEGASLGQDAQLRSAVRARHFFQPCAEGPCANGELVVTQRESRVAGGYPVVEVKHGPQFVRCTMCAKVLCTKCAEPITALQGKQEKTCLTRKG